MADDLGDEWWKESDDSGEDSGAEDSGEEKRVKKAVKRPAEDAEDKESSHVPAKKRKSAAGKEKVGKKKKKKQKTFARKKITEVAEDVLKKGGTPDDVQALLKPILAVSKSDDSHSDSDDNNDDDDDDAATLSLSADTDFFPANQEESAGEYLKELLPGWQVAVKEAKLPPGSPLMLILCSSAIRAVELNRELKSFLGKDCKTAKLFAKHMKLGEQKTFLEKKICHASIGTPNRVQALLESGSLKLTQTHVVVLDWNWRDVKLKRMVDIPDVRRDLTVLLKEHVVDHIKDTTCRIAIL